jgi:NDP-mannose synthase
MRAVILAGGRGTRLKPYTTVIPKPLVPVGETAIIEILIRRLQKIGITQVTVCLNHFARLVMAFLGDGSQFGLEITYSVEDKPLGTVAPIKLIGGLPEDFLVMNGDLLTDIDFADLFKYHLDNKSLLTVATYQRKTKIDFGVIEPDSQGKKASGFREKPEYSFEVSMGVYVMNRRVLGFVPDNRAYGFDDLMTGLLQQNQEVSLYRFNGYWLDIGRPDDYEKASGDLDLLKSIL